MGKVVDKFLLFLYSLSIFVASAIGFMITFEWIPIDSAIQIMSSIYTNLTEKYVSIIMFLVLFLLSIRFLYLALKRDRDRTNSIDQRTEIGDIRISIETVQNLSLKAAARIRGVKDLRARVKVDDSGLDIQLRAVVDGETSIPFLTEEIQRTVKHHVEEITGIPVSFVTVYIANVAQTQTFKSRVE